MAGGIRGRNGRLSAIVAAIVAVAALASLLVVRAMGSSTGGGSRGVARVTDGDGNVLELPLDEDATRTVETDLGTNVIEVKDGRVCVSEADCPNQDCVNQGWIESPSQQIVCLPHRLYVNVVGGEGSGIDVVGR